MSSEQVGESIEALLNQLDGSGTDCLWTAVQPPRSTLGESLPDYLLTRYQSARKWQVRSSCVYHCVRYARTSESAARLALLALNDKSKVVRSRACMVLACSQRKDLLSALQQRLENYYEDTVDDLRAAVDAITEQNQNYFVDRSHSGLTTLNIR